MSNGDETTICGSCGEITGSDFKFCSQCGERLQEKKEQEMKENEDSETEVKNSDTECEADSEDAVEAEESEEADKLDEEKVEMTGSDSEESSDSEEDSEEEVPAPPSEYSELKEYEYRKLQLLAMDVGVTANLKTEELRERLADEFDLEKPDPEQIESGETEVEPGESDAESESEKWKPNGDQPEPSEDGEDGNDSSDGSEDKASHPKKPESGSGGLNVDGGSGSGNGGHTDGDSEAGDGFNLPFIGMIFCLIALALLLLFAFWDYQSSEVKQKDETKVAQSSKKSEDSKDEQSEEESDETEKQTGLEYQSQRNLAAKVWDRIPEDLEPKLRKFEGLIGLRPRLAYEKCERFEELGDCGDFVDIYSRIDSKAVVEDRINDIRDRHQDTDS